MSRRSGWLLWSNRAAQAGLDAYFKSFFEKSARRFSTTSGLHGERMRPADILRAMTATAAELMGWQDRVGAIEPGKFADLIAVAGDTLRDISELERVKFVMKGGRVIRVFAPDAT